VNADHAERTRLRARQYSRSVLFRLTFLVILAIALVFSGYAPVDAHEIGTTRVSAILRDGRYDIEVFTDAASLLEKLEAVAGARARDVPTALTASVVEKRLTALDDIFRRRIAVEFDGSAVVPAVLYSVKPSTDGSSSIATIRLAGELPAGARSFRWTYSWTFASYALTVKSRPADNPATEWLEGGQPSAPWPLAVPPAPMSRAATAWRYLKLGFTHIVPNGVDHMLFVLGIFLLSGRWRTVLWQVSAFTVAHSITLGLSIYGLIAVRPAIVEPLIAVSIAYVAIENILVAELKPWRIALVFAFGLLHGMGFAGALQELGLPRSEFLTALVTFNVGVEGGQLAVIGVAFLLVGWLAHNRAWYRARIVVPASVVIACIAVYWTVERVAFAGY
jgi:hydrogenase/urease accessory protein HupE